MFGIIFIILILLGFTITNQYQRAQRLAWYSDTDAFYKDFGMLLFYIFMLGMMTAYLTIALWGPHR